MSTDILSGWAIRRNGSCLLTKEVDCGSTLAPFHACCPSSTECPHQYNVACCPSGVNCTASLVEEPLCANSSWTMFDNAGYFCCEKGLVGYNNGNTDGCSLSGASIPDGAVPLAVLDQASRSATTSTTTAATSTSVSSSSSSSPSPGSDTSSTAPAGIIAGSVVGGIAFIAILLASWYLYRRHGRRRDATASHELPQNEKDAAPAAPGRVEIDGNCRAELSQDATIAGRAHELP